MKKLYLLLIIIGQLVNAQVGINTTNPNAQLDIHSSNQASPLPTDGIMIPKVDTLIFPTAAQNGIMVFLTNSTTFLGSAKTPGFYYWDNTAADWLGLGSNTGWSTEGNTGTNPANNFIGTKDNADLVFKINNNPAGRLNQFNTSFGYNSLLNPVNLDNSAFGTSALSNIRFGSDNIAIGSSAMFFNQDGRRDIAIGNNALRTATNSNDNLAIGHSAMNATTTGEFNIAIGNSALQSGGTGNNNIAVGYQSQFSNSFGSDNVSVGKIALQNNTFGSGNTAIGNYTLGGTFMENSTALGTRALSSSNGQDNTGVGYQALDDNSSGRFNTGVGSNALGANSSGDSNTSVGHNSLLGNGSGSKNTAIGANATTSMNNLTNATAIGANAIVADNNSMVLGSVAGFNNSFDNTKVGIGTIVPAERLHVVGRIRMEDGNQGNGKVLVGDNNGVASWQNVNGFAWGTSGNFFTDSNVNFIGTSDPMDLVFKRNNIRSGLLSEENTIFGFNSHFSGQRNSVFGSHPFAGTLGGSNNSVFGYQALNACTSCGDNAVFGTNAMLFNTFGGANTAVGTDALRVNNSGNFNTAMGYNAAPNIGSGNGNVAIGSNALKNISFTNNNTGLGSETNFGGGVITNSTAIGAHAQVDFSNSIVLGSVNGVNGATSSVNVGMGTTNPSERLHVVGSIRMEDGTQGLGKVMTSDANGKASWQTLADSGATLDDAYDFGGAGAGRTITADAGAVLINGTDGLVSTGTFNSGAVAPTGTGTMMFWNPRKAAFRAGFIIGDDAVTGEYSTAFGFENQATGITSTAFGSGNIASGFRSASFGNLNISSGNTSIAFGQSNESSGNLSTAFGNTNRSDGTTSTVFGRNNRASSFAETVFGIGATTYTTSSGGADFFRQANALDRLFVVGNAIDSNSNGLIDTSERSDAIIVLKNGLTRLPSTTNTMITAADGKAVVTKEYLQSNTSGTLDQAYDFGGAGAGRTITADTGAVLINGTDGLVSTGSFGSGSFAPTGGAVKMVWNPRKAAFRAGSAIATEWNDANIGSCSVACGQETQASGSVSTAFGYRSIASGSVSTVFGNENTASNFSSIAFGYQNVAGGYASTAFGNQNAATNFSSTAFGNQNVASGSLSTAFGLSNNSTVFAETVIGIGATNYLPSTNGSSQFRTANATDRLFVVGNAIDANSNDIVDAVERRDAMVILKNGLTRLPSTTNAMITAADGKAIVTKEYLQSNTSAWGLTGNAGANPTTNFIGTTDNQSLIFRSNDTNRMAITGAGEVGIGTLVPSERLDVGVGNIAVTGGDIYLGAANGVLNAGGGLMTGLINYIGDAFVAPTVVNGDEDLYIADDIELGGQAYKPGGGAWVTTSDRRLKRNIEPYTDGLESILKINPVTYQYNSLYKTLDNGETYVGIIAQEMQQVAPYMVEEKPFGRVVEEDEKGNEKIVNQGTPYLTFDGSALTYMLINAIKEMNVKNELLQQENQALKKSVFEMNQKMELIIIEIEKLKK